MKSYTDLEQSKKLAEILPLDSADMWWSKNFIYYNPTAAIGISAEYSNVYTYKFGEDDIPCWSLAALIEALPLGVDIHNITDVHKMYYYVEIYTKEIYMKLKRMNKAEICLSSERHENLVDACVEMIIKLKENDLS